jgi:hypothetical protein
MMTASVVINKKNRRVELLKAVESAMAQPKSGSNELRVTGAGRKNKISWT